MICKILKDSDMDDIVVFAGGIIPDPDRDAIYSAGVRAIFGPGTSMSEPIRFLEEVQSRREEGKPTGVGEGGEWRWQ